MHRRVILILCSIITILSQDIAYAATCDDVRELIGKERLDSGTVKQQVDLKNSIGVEIGELEGEMTSETFDSAYTLYQNLAEEKKNKAETVSLLMQEDFFAPDIIEDAIEVQQLHTQMANNFMVTDDTVDLQATYNRLVEILGDKEKYINDSYDLGSLVADWPVSNVDSHSILKAFGERIYIYPEGETTEEVEVKDTAEWGDDFGMAVIRDYTPSESITLKATGGKMLLNTFNGVVIKSDKDKESNLSEIRIQSGKGLVISYRGKFQTLPKLGARVNQGMALTALATDEIYITAYLDGEPVNPAYFYGRVGKDANNARINYLLESENAVNLID